MNAINFRFATRTDADVIVALVESAYRGDSGRKGWTTESDLLDGQRTSLQDLLPVFDEANKHILLAERGNELLACCMLEVQEQSTYFGMFAVNPELQNQGIGKLMMDEAERLAKTSFHSSKMKMTVIDVRNELITYYERRGFHRTGLYEAFPYGDERFGIPKRDDLRFEVMEKNL